MSLKFFVVPIHQIETAEAELNRFVSSHRVISIEKHWVEAGTNSYWSICIDYISGSAVVAKPSGGTALHPAKIDYREILPPEVFQVYSVLREMRKSIGKADAVALYQVFNNEQLSRIALARPSTLKELQDIEGIGKGKTEKYGARVLETLIGTGMPSNETLRKTA